METGSGKATIFVGTNKGGNRTKKVIPIGTLLIAGVAICLGTLMYLALVLASIYLALGLIFLVLFILYRRKTNILSLAMITAGIAITILTTYVYNTLLVGIVFILIGLAGLVKTRRKEVKT